MDDIHYFIVLSLQGQIKTLFFFTVGFTYGYSQATASWWGQHCKI